MIGWDRVTVHWNRKRTAWYLALLSLLAVVRIYPVERRTCGGYVTGGAQPSCHSDLAVHAPVTVLANGFQYGSEAIGVGTTDASMEFHASPLPVLGLVVLAGVAWLVAGRLAAVSLVGAPRALARRLRYDRVAAVTVGLGLLSVVPLVVTAWIRSAGGLLALPPVGKTLHGVGELVTVGLLPLYLVSEAIALAASLLALAPLGFAHPIARALLPVTAPLVGGSTTSLPYLLVVELLAWGLLAGLVSAVVARLDWPSLGAGRRESHPGDR